MFCQILFDGYRWAKRTLERVLEDSDDTLKLFRGKVTSALGKVDIGLLADQVGVSATDTLDLGHSVHDLLLAIDVRVQQTDDVLEAADGQRRAQHFRFVMAAISSIPKWPPASATCTNLPDSMIPHGFRIAQTLFLLP